MTLYIGVDIHARQQTHKLVKLRTMVVNTLHALAINAGLSLRAQLLTRGGRKQLAGLQLSAISQQQRDGLVDELTRLAPAPYQRTGESAALVSRAVDGLTTRRRLERLLPVIDHQPEETT